MSTFTAEQAQQVGHLWERGTHRRYYLWNPAELIGLEITRYKSGSTRGASLGDEAISNAEAGRILSRIDGAYIDAHTGELVARNATPEDIERLVEAITAATTPEPQPEPAPAAEPTTEEGTTMTGEPTLTPDMLRDVEHMADGAILLHDDGTWEARSMIRRADETDEEYADAELHIVITAANMWDGHDLDGFTDDQRYEALAESLAWQQDDTAVETAERVEEARAEAARRERELEEVEQELARPGRPEIGPAINTRLPQELLDQLDAYAEAIGQTRAATIRDLLADALSTRT